MYAAKRLVGVKVDSRTKLRGNPGCPGLIVVEDNPSRQKEFIASNHVVRAIDCNRMEAGIDKVVVVSLSRSGKREDKVVVRARAAEAGPIAVARPVTIQTAATPGLGRCLKGQLPGQEYHRGNRHTAEIWR